MKVKITILKDKNKILFNALFVSIFKELKKKKLDKKVLVYPKTEAGKDVIYLEFDEKEVPEKEIIGSGLRDKIVYKTYSKVIKIEKLK